MSLNLTYADNADAVRRNTAKWSPAKTAQHRKTMFVLAVVFLLLFAAAFGVLDLNPIHAY